MYKRSQFQILKGRIDEPRKFIQVISGPRQVGKTTLVQQFLKEFDRPFHFVSADETTGTDIYWIEQQWETARFRLSASGGKEILLVFDEIQKIDNWSAAVKAQWDKDGRTGTNLKVILLGSARLLIQQGLTESLAGRFELIPMTHWSFSEMKEAFGFSPEKFVWFGGYPGAVDLMKDERRWKDYIRNALIETTISKDIFMLTRIQKPALLKQLFELACQYSGQILSFNKMLGQLQEAGNASTLSHYLQLLDSAGLVTGLEKAFKQPLQTKSSSPKLQVLNTALLSVYSPHDSQNIQLHPDDWGRHVESAVGAHLANGIQHSGMNLFYWRHGNDEVDFVLEKSGKFIGIEVKSGIKQKARGMSAFAKKFSPHKLLLVGKNGISWKEFLTVNPADLF